MLKITKITTTPDEIVTKIIEMPAAIMCGNGLTPDALLFATKSCTGGNSGNGGNAVKGSRRPRRDERDNTSDNKDERKEKYLWKCCHCLPREHITDNCLSKQRGDPPKSADTSERHQVKHCLLSLSLPQLRTIE